MVALIATILEIEEKKEQFARDVFIPVQSPSSALRRGRMVGNIRIIVGVIKTLLKPAKMEDNNKFVIRVKSDEI